MKKYRVEQFILCRDTYEVEAASEVEAAAKVLAGEGELLEGSFTSDYDSIAMNHGMPLTEEQINKLRALYEEVDPSSHLAEVIGEVLAQKGSVWPSIASVEEVTNSV